MAKGSEPAVSWKRHPGVPRECGVCKRTLTLELVGEYRTYWNEKPRRTVFWCVDHRGGRQTA